MNVYNIPLIKGPQTLSVAWPNGIANIRLIYCNAANGEGGWIMDIVNSSGTPIVQGVPLVTGVNLLKQYAYLNFGVVLFVLVNGGPSKAPGFADIGADAQLFVEF